MVRVSRTLGALAVAGFALAVLAYNLPVRAGASRACAAATAAFWT